MNLPSPHRLRRRNRLRRLLSLRRLPGLIGLLALLGPAGAALAAAAETARVEIQLVVPPLQRMSAGAAVASLPPITTSDLSAGYAELPRAIPFQLSSNCAWELRLRIPPSAPGKRQAETGLGLLWSLTGDRFQPATTDWGRIATGLPGPEVRLDLRIRIPLSWQRSTPGDYQPRIEYELVPAGF
jgi:hypothetical protein